MKKYFLCLAVLALIPAIFSKNCYAENRDDAKGFSISPFFQEINLAEDQKENSFDIEIANNTNVGAVLKLSVVDFGTLDETGGVAFAGDSKNLTSKYSLASWISLEKDALVIGSGEKQSIKVTIQNRDSLSPGGHYAAIIAKQEIEENARREDDHSQVALNSSFSSLIFARKTGGEIYELNLREQDISRRLLGLPDAVKLRFQNTGNVHLSPRGIVRLLDPLGREVERGVINEESSLILPETFRVFPVQMKKTATAFVPGNYKLIANYRYDGKNDFEIRQQKIFIIPMTDIIIIPIIIAGYIWFRIKIKKQKPKKIDKG